MKKIVSLITAFALILQFGVVSGFAAPTADKTLFKDTAEIYGVYDCSFTNLSILQIEKEGLTPYIRDLTDSEFYEPSDFSFTLIKYQLSSDKKSVTAYFYSYFEDVQYKGHYVFKKDAMGNISFSAQDYQGNVRNIYKTYNDSTELIEYIESPGFNKTLLAEKSLMKKLSNISAEGEKREAAFENSKAISTENRLDGFYSMPDKSQYLNINVFSDYNIKDYSGFYTYTDINYTIDTKTYYLQAKSFIVKNGIATYLQDAKNYMEITAGSRDAINHIKIVKNGKIVINQKVSLSLGK